jgi:hypothetical protein
LWQAAGDLGQETVARGDVCGFHPGLKRIAATANSAFLGLPASTQATSMV